MKRTLLIVGLVLAGVVALGAAVYLMSVKQNHGTTTIGLENKGSGAASPGKDFYKKVKEDLGVSAIEDQPNFLTDKNVSATKLSSAKTYTDILNTYRILPEQLLDLKAKAMAGKTDIAPPIKISLSGIVVTDSTKNAVAKQSDALSKAKSAPVFTFNTVFNDTFYKDLGKSLGVTNPSVAKDNTSGEIQITQSGEENGRIIGFNPVSGAFRFKSSGNYSKAASPPAASAIPVAQNYIYNNPALAGYTQNIDSNETTTYERKSSPGITYVVFHRGWNPLPILNSRYIYKLQTLGKTIEETVRQNLGSKIKDDDVLNTSDQIDGYARSEDFNTIVVAVAKEGVVSLTANMRPIEQTVSAVNLISSQQALENAKNNLIYKAVITPSSGGDFDVSKYAADGVVKLSSIEIDQIFLAYNEEPLNLQMNYFQPVYIMRGDTKINGEDFIFSFITPAISSQVKTSSLLEVSADMQTNGAEQPGGENEQGLRVDAWIPPASSIAPDNPPGNAGVARPSAVSSGTKGKRSWSQGMPSGGGDGMSLAEYASTAEGAAVIADFGGMAAAECPLIHLYSRFNEAFTLEPKAEGKIVYTYPPALDGKWNVTAQKSGLVEVGGKVYDKLYYEFSARQITPPSEGFIVKKDRTLDFLERDLLPKLNLTQNEIDAYLLDINYHVLSKAGDDAKFFKISLLPKGEIGKILPLGVNPPPQLLIRNFLVFEELTTKPNYMVKEPVFEKLDRQNASSILVENGCMLK